MPIIDYLIYHCVNFDEKIVDKFIEIISIAFEIYGGENITLVNQK